MQTFIFGSTVLGRPILGHRFGHSGKSILIFGGMHGDETEGVTLALGTLKECMTSFSLPLRLTIVPMLNLDGVLAGTRLNANRVDLNRNLPTRDWTAEVLNPRYPPGPTAGSEPETAALLRHFRAEPPDLILNLHSWQPMLNVNGDCELAASVLSRYLGYPIVRDMGYPTPGCLGTYCGLENNMPTLTYEIERGLAASSILTRHVPAVMETLKAYAERS